MGILRFLLKIIGIIFIIISVIAGWVFSKVSEWEAHPLYYIILYLILGLIPFLLGVLFLIGKEKFKEKLWFSVRIYTGTTFVVFLAFELYYYFYDWKYLKVSHPNDIYLDSIALPKYLNFIHIASMVGTIFSLLAIYFHWFKVSKYTYSVFTISLILIIAIPYFSKEDFRAIREEGIVMEIQGEPKTITWNEVYSVHLDGFINKVGRSKTERFEWNFIFETNQGTIEFGSFLYSNYGLENSLKIKRKINEEAIPIFIDPLSEDDWSIIRRHMRNLEDEEETPPNREDFYFLFEAWPIPKNYNY